MMKEIDQVHRDNSIEDTDIRNKFDTAYQLVCHLKEQTDKKKKRLNEIKRMKNLS